MQNLETMKAIIQGSYGPANVLSINEVAVPTITESEVLIKVHNTSVTQADTMMRKGEPKWARAFLGLKKPKAPIPGTGFSGTIIKKGDDVHEFKIGDEVCGGTTLQFSTWAQYIAIGPNDLVMQKPKEMSFSEACTLTDGPLTSFNFIHRIAQLKPNQTILINGASGALGSAAVQIAKQIGAKVVGVCSTKNIAFVKSLGADEVIDYTKIDFTSHLNAYDVIYDTVGKSSFSKSKRSIKNNGKYITPVLKIRLIQDIFLAMFTSKKAIFDATGLLKKEQTIPMLKTILKLYDHKKLNVKVSNSFNFEDYKKAHEIVDSQHKVGNVVLSLMPNDA